MTKVILFLALVLTTYVVSANSTQNEQEVLDYLKRLNKPAVKSIKSSDGDIIDCVKITDQPAFDHPSLKNHTIKLSPKYDPTTMKGQKTNNDEVPEPFTQLWQLNGTCPQGTIPITRTKKSDLLRADSLETFGKKPNVTDLRQRFPKNQQSEYEYAIAKVTGDDLQGARGSLNVWQPIVQKDEFSSSRIWLRAGPYHSQEVIEAGWHVNPQATGDNQARLFIYWTSDKGLGPQGCYNLKCSGFIQISKKLWLGAPIQPLSSYKGKQYNLDVSIWRDSNNRDWWLRIGNEMIGYWPYDLFDYLHESATEIHWGGEVLNRRKFGQHTSTDMGGGHFAKEGWQKASYISQIQVTDKYNDNFRDPSGLSTTSNHPNCYDVIASTSSSKSWGTYIYYGGPGRNTRCP
ncbi:hypothetical protein ACFE04_027174 [Oxalis oulophora]